jgi:cobalt-zinc-cadmium efflux system outer membrane protein
VVLNLPDAVAWALQNNPGLAAVRQQHGIAAAGVVIARTYPFNPVWVNKPFAVGGPPGITNRLAMEQRVTMDLEVRGQGRYRRQLAAATLTRTDWEIAAQEVLLAVQTVRAYKGVLYYQAKRRLAEESVGLSEQTAEQVRRLVEGVQLRPQDLILARTEIDTARAALDTAHGPEIRAAQDLRRALGMTEGEVTVQGTFELPAPPAADVDLFSLALEHRPDLHARQLAVAEAQARVRLTVADRFGNPNIGPDFEYNETSDYFLGAQITLPLPVFNTRRGDILQRKAEETRAALDLHTVDVTIRQEVRDALERLRNARTRAESYRTQILPRLETALKDVQALMSQGGVPVLTVIDIQRRLLRARDLYLDVLFEVHQAQADLAASVGDPDLAIGP